MADSTGKERIDNQENNQPEKLSDEIISTNESGIVPSNQETGSMEVHHHPDVEKKNLKEYLLEGLMIFIAVTLGFFAESLREHFTNEEIAHTNMASLIRNLEEDSLNLVETIKFNDKKTNWMDSFVGLKKYKRSDTGFQKQFIYYAIKLSASQSFISNQTAFEQMKSSGTLRLINPPKIVDSILKYESMYEVIKLQEGHVATWETKAENEFVESTDFTVLSANLDLQNLNMRPTDLKADQLPKVKNDPVLLQKFFNYEVAAKSSLLNYIYFLNKQLSYVRILIPFLKQEKI